MEILEENRIFVVYIPATNKAFVWRIRSLANRGFLNIDYGPLPIPAGYLFASYAAGMVPAPAAGVMPGFTYVPIGLELSFPFSGVFDEGDMWYLPKDYRERVFHVVTHVTPAWLRCEITVPKGVSQGKFQKDKVTTGVERLFGYVRGEIETVHLPGLRYGYRFGNDSNLNVYTGVSFKYGEYVVETPKDANFIFDVLSRKVKADKWISLPIQVYDESIRRALIENYGMEGFPVYGINQRETALPRYNELLKEVHV